MTDVGNAIIFRRGAHDDHDLFLEFFSEQYGRVSAVARGAQKATSKLRGHLEPFRLVRLFMPHPRGRFVVGEAITIENFCVNPTAIFYQSALIAACESYTPYRTPLPEVYRVMRRHLSKMKTISEGREGESLLTNALCDLAFACGMQVPTDVPRTLMNVWEFLGFHAPNPLQRTPVLLDATPQFSVV